MTATEESAPAVQDGGVRCASPFACHSPERNPQGDSILPQRTCGKYVHLDVTRVGCIVAIALCAGEASWLKYNTLFFQNWVIQYLWLVCGICYGLSSRPIWEYSGRLLLYFFLGIAAIWAACRIKKVGDFSLGGNMWFVIVLGAFSFILMPLKRHLQKIIDNPHQFRHSSFGSGHTPEEHDHRHDVPTGCEVSFFRRSLWLCGGLAFLMSLVALAILPLSVIAIKNSSGAEYDERGTIYFTMHLCSEVQACVSAIWICWIFPYLFNDMSTIAWLLLVNMYTFKFVCGYSVTSYFSSGFQLMLVGLTAGRFGLSWRQEISTCVQRYWMAIAFLGAWCFLPGTHGMFMLFEPQDLLARQKFILLEAILVICWLVSGADMVDPKIFEVDELTWFSDWASLVFLLQQAVLIIIPDGNWLVFLGLMPVVLTFRKITGLSSVPQVQSLVNYR